MSKRATFVLRTLPGQTGRSVSTLRPPDRRFKQSRASVAGTSYRAGSSYRGEQVEVRVVGDAVEISHAGQIIRVYVARHDCSKEHGAFATPGGRPRRRNAADHSRTQRNTRTGANL